MRTEGGSFLGWVGFGSGSGRVGSGLKEINLGEAGFRFFSNPAIQGSIISEEKKKRRFSDLFPPFTFPNPLLPPLPSTLSPLASNP